MMDADYTKVMFGQHAVHVPAWLVVQDQGEGLVSFVGATRMEAPHPMRYGSDKTHQLVIGEIVIRPHIVTATNSRKGSGLAGFVSDPFRGLHPDDAHAEKILDLRRPLEPGSH
jgi:hypothetical protein